MLTIIINFHEASFGVIGQSCQPIGLIGGNITRQLRLFLFFSLLLFSQGCRSKADLLPPVSPVPSPRMTILGQREYAVQQELRLVNEGPGRPDKQNIWVALIRDFPPYQSVRSIEVSPKDYQLVVDEYGNHYAEFDFSKQPAGTTRTVKIDTRVIVNELAYDLSDCEGDLPPGFTQPELHIESANPQIVALSARLSEGKSTACQKVRTFYDYIGDNLVYTYNGNNWGAQAALGPMGADCTEYADLLVALSRAQGIPARYFEGVRYLENGADEIANIEHAWSDVAIPGLGWVSLDPTLGRIAARRDTYFAHHTPDHIILTMGTNPSTLRGSSYWTHLYWPGNSTKIQVNAEWKIELIK